MNTLFFLWTSLCSACRAFSRNSDKQEQQAFEAYLSQSQSVNDLEYRERQWMRTDHSGNDFFAVSN